MRIILTTLHSKFIHPSLALPYLASYCAQDDHELIIREFTVHEPKEVVLAALLAEAPEVIAFSVYLWNRSETLELVDLLATVQPELRIVLGGPEVSFDGDALLTAHPGVTALVRGEGELPIRALLQVWASNSEPQAVPRLIWRRGTEIIENPDGPFLADLDTIPSPFSDGRVDLTRGFVYYETSRGCPYRCSFCMSARDSSVRSFSMARIKADLGLLLAAQVPRIKFVDRTFNYDPVRARELLSFILQHNRSSHLHFEIGAHLIDEATIALLEGVPPDTFQFEIGVQSTLPATLQQIDRHVALDRLLANVRALRQRTRVNLHLDLIAGLPGETVADVLGSIDTVMDLQPHQLQIEPVKVLPGAPLRDDAARLGLRFDPNPPYTVVGSETIDFNGLEQLRQIGRLLDLTWNSDRLQGFLSRLATVQGSWSAALTALAADLHRQGAFRHPLSQTALFQAVAKHIEELPQQQQAVMREVLAYDYALCERVLTGGETDFFDTGLNATELDAVESAVGRKRQELSGQGVKLQHFAAIFYHLDQGKRQVRLFYYLTRSHQPRSIEVEILAV